MIALGGCLGVAGPPGESPGCLSKVGSERVRRPPGRAGQLPGSSGSHGPGLLVWKRGVCRARPLSVFAPSLVGAAPAEGRIHSKMHAGVSPGRRNTDTYKCSPACAHRRAPGRCVSRAAGDFVRTPRCVQNLCEQPESSAPRRFCKNTLLYS